MPEPLGFCIVGCGMIARFHVRALQEIPGARVAALVSRSQESAEKLITEAGLPPVPVFHSVEEAVKAPGVDAVVITTPSGAHREPAITAAKPAIRPSNSATSTWPSVICSAGSDTIG